MFQDKTAFLEYPSRYVKDSFDLVWMKFHLDRARCQMDMIVFNDGLEVAKFYAHVPADRLYEQYGIEQLFAERCGGKGVKYEIEVHGSFPAYQQN